MRAVGVHREDIVLVGPYKVASGQNPAIGAHRCKDSRRVHSGEAAIAHAYHNPLPLKARSMECPAAQLPGLDTRPGIIFLAERFG